MKEEHNHRSMASAVDLNASVDSIGLSSRARNALTRAGVHTLGALMECSDEELMRVRGLGTKSIKEIHERLGDLEAAGAWLKSLRGELVDLPPNLNSTDALANYDRRIRALIDQRGLCLPDLVRGPESGAYDTRQSLSLKAAGKEVTVRSLVPHPSELLERWMESFPDRIRQVVRLRFNPSRPTPLTLEETAAEAGVTRQRVFQIQQDALRQLANWPFREAFEELLRVTLGFVSDNGGMVSVNEIGGYLASRYDARYPLAFIDVLCRECRLVRGGKGLWALPTAPLKLRKHLAWQAYLLVRSRRGPLGIDDLWASIGCDAPKQFLQATLRHDGRFCETEPGVWDLRHAPSTDTSTVGPYLIQMAMTKVDRAPICALRYFPANRR